MTSRLVAVPVALAAVLAACGSTPTPTDIDARRCQPVGCQADWRAFVPQRQFYVNDVSTTTTTTVVEPVSDPIQPVSDPIQSGNHEDESPPLGGSAMGGTCEAPGPPPPEYIKQRESGGDYGLNDPNGHYGAWQFAPATWEGVGGTGNPADASPEEQDCRAAVLWDNGRGRSHWAATA